MSRSTEQKRAVTDAITSSDRPLSANEILDAAQEVVPGLGIATVYRQVKRLVDNGKIVSVELPGEPARYECASHDHHHHFRCDTCERVFDVPGCHAHIDNDVPDGFVVDRHEVILYGTCADCAD